MMHARKRNTRAMFIGFLAGILIAANAGAMADTDIASLERALDTDCDVIIRYADDADGSGVVGCGRDADGSWLLYSWSHDAGWQEWEGCLVNIVPNAPGWYVSYDVEVCYGEAPMYQGPRNDALHVEFVPYANGARMAERSTDGRAEDAYGVA